MPLTPTEIKEKLLGALDGDYNIQNENVVVEVIGILERFPITKEDLELTRIGKHVNELRRKTANQDLCRRSKNLVRSWQKLVLNDVSASGSPAAASSPRLPPRLSGSALPGPRTSSPLVSVSSSSAGGSQPRSPAGLHPRGMAVAAAMSISTSPLVRTPASPAQPVRVVSTPAAHSGSRPVPPAGVPAVVALRETSRLVSPAAGSGDKAHVGTSAAGTFVGGKNVSSPAVPRQPVGAASSSPALRPPAAALPGATVPPPASPRLPSIPGTSRLESATTASYSRTATPPSVSPGPRQARMDKPGANRSASSLQGSVASPVQKPAAQSAAAVSVQRNGSTAADSRLRMAPCAGAASSVSPASSTHSVGTLRPGHHYQSGDSHRPATAAGSKHPASDRANGDLSVERTAMSRTNAANKKRRRSDDSIGSSSTTSSAPPRKLPFLNGDAGPATSVHASVASMKNMAAQERRPSKVKTTAQLIAELQASKGGDGLLKSDTITRIVSNQIEREKYVEHESVVPASAKPRPRKKPGVSSAFAKPPDTPDSASLAKTKSEMVQKYLSSSMLANSGNGGEDSQMTFASSSPSTLGAPSFLTPDNAADHDEDDEFIDIEGLDTASTPDGQRLSQAATALRPSSTGAATAASDSQIKGRAAQLDDPYSLLPPLNVDEIVWSEDEDRPTSEGICLAASCDDSAIDRLHDAKWPGVNGVFADGHQQWRDWTETIVHGNESGSTLFILPYVDVGD